MIFLVGKKKSDGLGETEGGSPSFSLLYVAGDALQTLMLSDRTLKLDSLQGGVLK